MFAAKMQDPLYQRKRTFKTDSEGAPWASLYAGIRFSIFQFLAILREPGIQLNTSTQPKVRGKKCQAALKCPLEWETPGARVDGKEVRMLLVGCAIKRACSIMSALFEDQTSS